MAVRADSRKHKRRCAEIPVRWTIDAQGREGEGMLLDISRTGARLRLTTDFDARGGATFGLRASTVPLLPRTARLRWFRRLPGRTPTYLCGVVFLQLGTNLEDWGEWLNAQSDDELLKFAS